MNPRTLLEHVYREAVAACDPRSRTANAVRALPLEQTPALIAVGKAAVGMAEGACDALEGRGLEPTIGLVVSESRGGAHVRKLAHETGDHPVPGERSVAAAAAIAEVAAHAAGQSDVLVLVSGGATSLIAAPLPPLERHDLARAFETLLASGAPITVMNMVRRRLLQWGAGRLAAALSPANVYCLIVSDVMGGDVGVIGSGPCVPDQTATEEVLDTLRNFRVELQPAVLAALNTNTTVRATNVRVTTIILENANAVSAARSALRTMSVELVDPPIEVLSGEAAATGERLGRSALSLGRAGRAAFVVGGETTVTLGAATVAGGRCQELALAAARALRGSGAALLAAGTDGRDGPTDAAGAVVDGGTWDAIIAAGRLPDTDLATHRSNAALGAVQALLNTGPTGTNVNDLVIALA